MAERTNTMKKLDEAKFFLERMKAPDNNRYFDYYLSAYISASRSVLWVMKAEFTHVQGWEKWYDSQTPTVEEKLLLKKINDIRVRTTKKKPLHTSERALLDIPKEHITEEVKEFMKAIGDKKVEVSIQESQDDKTGVRVGDEQITFTGKISEMFRRLPEFRDEDIIKVCERYVAFLKRLVVECEKEFGEKIEHKLVESFSFGFTEPDLFK